MEEKGKEEGTVGAMLMPMLKIIMKSLNMNEEDLKEWANQGGEERRSLLKKIGINDKGGILNVRRKIHRRFNK